MDVTPNLVDKWNPTKLLVESQEQEQMGQTEFGLHSTLRWLFEAMNNW